MASRFVGLRASAPSRLLTRPAGPLRNFQTSTRRLETVTAPAPVKKPVGAFRGGLFGFFLGSSLAGAAVWYYILEEYKVYVECSLSELPITNTTRNPRSNELLTEDIYALQSVVQRSYSHMQQLEEKVEAMEKKAGR